MKAIVVVIFEFALTAVLILAVNNIESIPYNIRELFSIQNSLSLGAVFLVTFNLIFGFPVVSGFGLTRSSGMNWAFLFPVSILICGALVFVLLNSVVPMESIHDVVGSPVLNWPWKWEQAFRFMFLVSPFIGLWAGAAILAKEILIGTVRGKQAILKWCVCMPFLLLFSYLVIVSFAATDNLTELLENGGGWIPALGGGLWILLMGIVPSFICVGIVFERVSIKGAVFLVLVSLPLGYILMDFTLMDDLYKYGSHFSGLQFLLSTDRNHYVDGGELIARYALFHLGLNLMMGICQLPFWEIWRAKADYERR